MSMAQVPGMKQTKAAADMLWTLEAVQHIDILDVLDAAEEIARGAGATRLDREHIQAALDQIGRRQEEGHA